MVKKYIFIVGGVISGVGKGIVTASLGRIIKEYGYKTTLVKIDPYFNYDAGTLRPTEHGEVWVTSDGGEIDLDLGTYERFMDQDMPKKNNMTSGCVYHSVIERERQGGYLGQTVQFVPHIPDEIVARLEKAGKDYDVVLVEIGGTVGDFENKPFLFAAKALEGIVGPENVAYVLVSYLPIPASIGEMKTKPTQQAIAMLRREGLYPDFVICRSEKPIDEIRKKKISHMSHVPCENIIALPDVSSIYSVPLLLQSEQLGKKVLQRLQCSPKKEADLSAWSNRVALLKNPEKRTKIALVGKYVTCGDYVVPDSYMSVEQALAHAGVEVSCAVDVTCVDSEKLVDQDTCHELLAEFDGILIPGGFGTSGIEGKINAIRYAREHNKPYLGLCYGMQLAVVEFARNVAQLTDAHTVEVNEQTSYPVVATLESQKDVLENEQYGGTMRLGAYPALLDADSRVYQIYKNYNRVENNNGKAVVSERHRHRYEVNPEYVPLLQEKGLVFSGFYEHDSGQKLAEFIELSDHPFFVATQAHPEFTSRLGNPNPLFAEFIKACL